MNFLLVPFPFNEEETVFHWGHGSSGRAFA
jgi:hypothetical protein